MYLKYNIVHIHHLFNESEKKEKKIVYKCDRKKCFIPDII